MAALLLVAVIAQARRIGALGRRIEGLTRGSDGATLEGVLDAHLRRVQAVGRQVEGLEASVARLEAVGRRSFQRVGVVRFNPFEDTGGNQSFAIALLDAAGDGFVLSSLHGRGGTRVYAKAVSNGVGEATLSAEEVEALRVAQSQPERPGGV